MSHRRGTSAVQDHLPVATAIWYCDPNYITCYNGHLRRHADEDFAGDRSRVYGHAFFRCLKCEEAYVFVLLATLPSPMATCYLISKESFQEWNLTGHPTPPTPELLYLLRDPDGRSYNPYWRPSR